jgi:hypothetical protein
MVACSTYAAAQSSPMLGRFIAQENNGIVYINLQILAGSTCNGIKLFHSVDSVNYSEIGRIEGVCGDISNPESYNFIHQFPAPGLNYYKLELGIGSFSDVILIEIIMVEESSYQIRPNPVINKSRIYFNNESHEKYNLFMHNINGQKVLELTTKEEYFEINAQALKAGLYIFTIFDFFNKPFDTGKLIVR